MAEDRGEILEKKPETSKAGAPSPPPVRQVPISGRALGFLRLVGWAVAVIGVIVGIYVLTQIPEGPSNISLRFVGWGQIIGSVVTGVLLNVISGIGEAVLDIWEDQIRK